MIRFPLRLLVAVLIVVLWTTINNNDNNNSRTIASAFVVVPPPRPLFKTTTTTTAAHRHGLWLNQQHHEDDAEQTLSPTKITTKTKPAATSPIVTTNVCDDNNVLSLCRQQQQQLHQQQQPSSSWQRSFATMTMACSLAFFTTFLPTTTTTTTTTDNSHNNIIMHRTTISMVPPSAHAKEMASGTGSRVNKDPESLLRYGLPITNKQVRILQDYIEGIKYDIGSKRKLAALDKLQKAKSIITNEKSVATNLLASCHTKTLCASILDTMKTTQLSRLQQALQDSLQYSQGSDQERQALDDAYQAQSDLAKAISTLEQAMVPVDYKTPVPDLYNDLPQLQGGRAQIEMVIQKPSSTTHPFDVNSQVSTTAKLVMIVDGYTAPVTAGNFVDLVQKGFYNKMPIQRADGFVVQTGDPDGEAFGYTGAPASKSIGAGPHGERLIPNEIFLRGDDGPFYESTMEDEGRGGQAAVLPFSAYGAMGWARDEYDPNSGSSQFFWLLFDSDLTPAGKNVLDGRYPCFGYVVEGAEYLSDLEEGDVIVSAKVTEGLEYLVQPPRQASG